MYAGKCGSLFCLVFLKKRESQRFSLLHHEKTLTNSNQYDIERNMIMCYDKNERKLTNLDNSNIALPSVQVSRELTTTNGCHVSLLFPGMENPRIHHEIAGMLIAAFVKKRSNDHETSALPVQSIDQRAG